MTTRLIATLVGELKLRQDEIARCACIFPKSNPVEQGVQAGKYQGLQLALDTIDNILRDDNEKEQSQ